MTIHNLAGTPETNTPNQRKNDMSQFEQDGNNNYDSEYNASYQAPKSGGRMGTVLLIGCGCLGAGIIIACVLAFVIVPVLIKVVNESRLMHENGEENENVHALESCHTDMTYLLMAMNAYHEDYDCYPPAYTVDEDGKPLHSWRVLILPYIEEYRLHYHIKQDEPWDSEHNSVFHVDEMPYEYGCVTNTTENWEKGYTSFKMVLGPNSISDGPNSRSKDEIKRPLSELIVLVEVIPSTNWMEPVDITEEELQKGANHSRTEGIGSTHINPETEDKYYGFTAGYLDGTAKFLKNEEFDPEDCKF